MLYIKTIAFLFAVVSFATALPTKLEDVVCEDGGITACLAYCAAEGYNCGYCAGTEPNVKCVCEHCSEIIPISVDIVKNLTSCSLGSCNAQCKSRGSDCTGSCVGFYPTQVCMCNCPSAQQSKSCDLAICDNTCFSKGPSCIGDCSDGVCTCICQNNEVISKTTKDLCYNRCKRKNCAKPRLPNSGVCECTMCTPLNRTLDASCTYGGRVACIASCKIQDCDTGYCEGTEPNETCVCSGC
jgi:hypothetical protein